MGLGHSISFLIVQMDTPLKTERDFFHALSENTDPTHDDMAMYHDNDAVEDHPPQEQGSEIGATAVAADTIRGSRATKGALRPKRAPGGSSREHEANKRKSLAGEWGGML